MSLAVMYVHGASSLSLCTHERAAVCSSVKLSGTAALLFATLACHGLSGSKQPRSCWVECIAELGWQHADGVHILKAQLVALYACPFFSCAIMRLLQP